MPEVALVLGASTGGIGRHVRSLVGLLPGHGWQVRVVCPAATEALFDYAGSGARVIPVTVPAGLTTAGAVVVPRLRQALRGADVVHAHGLRAGALTAAALGRSRAPLVVTWHNAPLGNRPRRWLAASAERSAGRHAAVTVAASADLAERARALGASDVRLLPVAAPERTADPPAIAALRGDLDLGDRPVVLAVGRLHPQKGLDVLIRAAARWGERRPAPITLVAGDGPARASLQRLIRTTGADVRLLGPRDDVAALLALATVVAVPSRWEARALIAQEAARAGVPQVVTSVGGLPDLLGDAALFVPSDSPTDLADAVCRMLDDEKLAARLAHRARERAAGWPTERDTVAALDRLYRELLDS